MRRFLLPVAMLIAASVQVMAQSVENLSIRAVLHRDGSASVTQKWAAEVVRGTEFYIPISNLKDMSVSNLRVNEGGREFVSEGTGWDVDRSITQKAGRCGIVDKGSEGVEICWGVGEYGKHVWNVSFDITGLVQAFQDYDAFNFQFVNPGLYAPPQQVRIVIENDFGAIWTDEDTREWGFGCDGTVDLIDGKIQMESNVPLSSSQYVNLMVRFNKGIFSPSVSRDIPFEKMQKGIQVKRLFILRGLGDDPVRDHLLTVFRGDGVRDPFHDSRDYTRQEIQQETPWGEKGERVVP